MTISSLTSRVMYPGAGSVGPFAFQFRIFSTSDLLVTLRDSNGVETVLVYGTDFTVSGVGNASGSITLTTALAVGETLAIRRAPSLTQPTSLQNQGSYFAKTHEDEFDRLVMQVQSLQDQINRAARLLESYDPDVVATTLKPETGKVLAWQSATELGNSTLDSSATALPGSGRTVATLTAYLLNNAVYNVKDYGAIGDGIVDDTAAIVAAEAAANGAIVYFPPGIYKFSRLRTRGTVPFRFCGAGRLVTRLQQTAAANIGLDVGFNGNVEGCELTDLWLEGNATALGGISLGNVTYYTAFTKLNRVRITGYAKVGGYGLSLGQVQELDAQDVYFKENYDNVYRPNLGFVTSAVFHGQFSYIGLATHRGVSLEGVCSDITFRDVVIEDNAREGFYHSGYPSVIVFEDCYIEANGSSGAGQAQIYIAGGAPMLYNGCQVRVIRCNFHIPNAAFAAMPQLKLDLVRLSTVAQNRGLDQGGALVVTANVQCHFEDNADNDASDYIGIYRALVAISSQITARDIEPLGRRFEFGNVMMDTRHLRSTQAANPTTTIQVAQAGTLATSITDANATDTKGVLTLNGGSAAWNAGIQTTVNFRRAYSVAPVVILTPGNHYAALAIKDLAARSDNVTVNGFDLVFGIAPVAQRQYLFNYLVIE